ncbi:MAG: hypothetical protein KDC99_19895, partial [Cyclobacteriaceae bacterium]|nr:hypothetical protein [Cyclobacteriaceae bacterium]
MSKFLLIPLLFVTSCAHRTLNSDDNHRSINVYAKKYKTAYIFFYDSTKVKVTSLHIENHVVYWTDVTTNASDHDSLCVIRKIGF